MAFNRLFNLLSACVVFWEPNVEFFQHGGRVQVNTDADFVYVVDAFNVKAGVKYALDNNSIIEIQYPGPCGTFQWGSYTFCTCDPITGGINCPPVEAIDSTAPAKVESYPLFFIAGMVNVPTVATLATALPEIIPIKPLAITAEELAEIRKVHDALQAEGKGPRLMVGFNRRFAPHIQHCKRFFENAVGPYVLQYRVNAGAIPRTHWTRDPLEGGGRIIGEVCHFIDLMQYLTSSLPERVYAESLSSGSRGSQDDDSVVVTLKFRDGSLGTITYLANGDASFPKERVEISSTGRTAVIDNFQRLSLYQSGKKREFKLSTIDKGHRDEVREFLASVQEGKPSPIMFDSIVATTLATLKAVQSLQLGTPVSF